VERAAVSIRSVTGFEVLDSRGRPTVACRVELADGAVGVARVPSGASTGTHEARELRDGDERFAGLGVRRAVANLDGEIDRALAGLDARDQARVDARLVELDGRADLSRLGANTTLAASVATALAAAASERLPLYRLLHDGPPLLPLPMVNVLSGGAHAGGAIDFQDFLVVPVGAASFAQAIEWCAAVRRSAAELATTAGHPAHLVADEGGLGLALGSNRTALELLHRSVEAAGLEPGADVAFAVDAAATQLVEGGRYHLASEGRTVTSRELVDELVAWAEEFPIVSVEDPLSEDDWEGWAYASRELGGRLQLLGDDLFVTDHDRLARGIREGVANAVLVKPNQCGTLSCAARVCAQAREAGYATVVSARSGETEDSWLADLAVGWRAGQLKVGSTTRSERTAKWNRLLELEALEPGATFAARAALAPLSRA
jgi:enolase